MHFNFREDCACVCDRIRTKNAREWNETDAKEHVLRSPQCSPGCFFCGGENNAFGLSQLAQNEASAESKNNHIRVIITSKSH